MSSTRAPGEALLGEDLGGHRAAARRGCGRRRAAARCGAAGHGAEPSRPPGGLAAPRRAVCTVWFIRRLDEDVDRHRVPERLAGPASCTPAPRPASTGSRSSSPTSSPRRRAPRRSGRSPTGSGSRSTSTSRSATPRASARTSSRDVLRRAEAKFALMQRLGIDTMLVCSNVGTATVDDDDVSADQLRRLGDLARGYGVRIAYEALAWGRYVDDYRRAWRIVRAGRPPGRRHLPGQLPHPLPRPRPRGDRGDPRREDLLPPARRRSRALDGRAVVEPPPPAVPRRGQLRPHRLPRATCSPPATTGRCRWRSSTTPSGRPTPSGPPGRRSARCAGWPTGAGAGSEAGPSSPPPGWPSRPGYDFVEVRAADTEPRRGAARPARLHVPRPAPQQGGPAVDPGRGAGRPQRAARRAARPRWPRSASRSPTPTRRPPTRGAAAGAARPPHGRTPARRSCAAFTAPDGTEVFLGRRAGLGRREFDGGRPARPRPARLSPRSTTSTWSSRGSTTTRRCCSTAACSSLETAGVDRGRRPGGAGPQPGDALDRRPACGSPLNLLPAGLTPGSPQHVAFACDDIARRWRGRRGRAACGSLPVPDNYYDDLDARFDLDPELLAHAARARRPLRPRRRRRVPALLHRAPSARCSSRSSSAAAGTTATAPPTRRSGWPPARLTLSYPAWSFLPPIDDQMPVRRSVQRPADALGRDLQRGDQPGAVALEARHDDAEGGDDRPRRRRRGPAPPPSRRRASSPRPWWRSRRGVPAAELVAQPRRLGDACTA